MKSDCVEWKSTYMNHKLNDLCARLHKSSGSIVPANIFGSSLTAAMLLTESIISQVQHR